MLNTAKLLAFPLAIASVWMLARSQGRIGGSDSSSPETVAAQSAPFETPIDMRGEAWSHTIEYRTPTRDWLPVAESTENVAVFTVPTGRTLYITQYSVPLGIPVQGSESIMPLGLGSQGTAEKSEVIPKTPHFKSAFEEPITLNPPIRFDEGTKVVVRYAQTVKGTRGFLFLNGRLQ